MLDVFVVAQPAQNGRVRQTATAHLMEKDKCILDLENGRMGTLEKTQRVNGRMYEVR